MAGRKWKRVVVGDGRFPCSRVQLREGDGGRSFARRRGFDGGRGIMRSGVCGRPDMLCRPVCGAPERSQQLRRVRHHLWGRDALLPGGLHGAPLSGNRVHGRLVLRQQLLWYRRDLLPADRSGGDAEVRAAGERDLPREL